MGIGTLYRNFPTRQDLLEAVYISEIEELLQAARDAAEREPWEAFEIWLRRFSSYVATKLAMLQALNKDSEMFRVCRSAMYEAANPLFARARAAGEIRDDVAARRRPADRLRRHRGALRRRRAARARLHARARRDPRALGAAAGPARAPAPGYARDVPARHEGRERRMLFHIKQSHAPRTARTARAAPSRSSTARRRT